MNPKPEFNVGPTDLGLGGLLGTPEGRGTLAGMIGTGARVGAVPGAIIGGGLGAYNAKKNKLRAALLGALGGGGIGAGVGAGVAAGGPLGIALGHDTGFIPKTTHDTLSMGFGPKINVPNNTRQQANRGGWAALGGVTAGGLGGGLAAHSLLGDLGKEEEDDDKKKQAAALNTVLLNHIKQSAIGQSPTIPHMPRTSPSFDVPPTASNDSPALQDAVNELGQHMDQVTGRPVRPMTLSQAGNSVNETMNKTIDAGKAQQATYAARRQMLADAVRGTGKAVGGALSSLNNARLSAGSALGEMAYNLSQHPESWAGPGNDAPAPTGAPAAPKTPWSLKGLPVGALGAAGLGGAGLLGLYYLMNRRKKKKQREELDGAPEYKFAKVYEASEAVDGMKPKEVYESHKKCAPGEFGMNKEGGNKTADQFDPPQFDLYDRNSIAAWPYTGAGAGAGVGALAGGLYGLATGKKGKRTGAILRGMLGGGLMGGGAGLGAGYFAGKAFPKMRQPTLEGAIRFLGTPKDQQENAAHKEMYGVNPLEMRQQVGNAALLGGAGGLAAGGGAALLANTALTDREDKKEEKQSAFTFGQRVRAGM